MSKTIELTKGLVTIVDDDVFDKLSAQKWYAQGRNGHPYAARCYNKDGKKITEYMHKLIIPYPFGFETDHINGMTLDNRKSNLRVCSHYHNCLNQKKRLATSSSFKGVSFINKYGVYRAIITNAGKQIYLGSSKSAIEAAKLYNAAAIKFHGEFAKLNNLDGATL